MLTTEFSIPVSVEVSIADLLRGIFEIEGLLNYSDETLTIEYQTNELLARASKVATIDLSLDVLREVTFKRRFPGPVITLRPRRLTAFEDVPISTNAQIVLKVKWAHRKEAEALVSHLQRVMSYRSTPGQVSRIPYRGPDVGLRTIKGDLYLEDEEFLVFDVKDALVGDFDTNQQLIKVAPRALMDVRLEERRSYDRLYIRPKNRGLLDAMPGSNKDELMLKIHRNYREEVGRLIYNLARLSSRDASPHDEPASGGDRTTN